MSKKTFVLTIVLIGLSIYADANSKSAKRNYAFKLDYTHDTFDQDLDPWDSLSVGLGIKLDQGTLIPRWNRARRFGEQGSQVEVDYYPRFGHGRYMYLNLGYSESFIFPKYRFGAELFQSMDNGYEISGGLRKLYFPSISPTIWTGSVAKYWSEYYIAFRPFFVTNGDDYSWSALIEVRRYTNDDVYLTAKVGGGSYSDQSAARFEMLRLSSRWASLGIHRHLQPGTAINGSLTMESTEPRPNVERRQTSVAIGFDQEF